MPNYKGHLFGGCVVYGVALLFLVGTHVTFFLGLEWLAFTLLGSLFPDIDTKSKGQKIFYKMLLAVVLYLMVKQRFFALAMISLISFIPLIVPHRGICHRLWFVLSIPCALVIYCHLFFPAYAFLVFWDAFFFSLGAISHLWLDMGFKKMVRMH